MGGGSGMCCKMKHVDSKDEYLSGFYMLLGPEPYWKLPSYCYSPCVYVRLEDYRGLIKDMNGMGGMEGMGGMGGMGGNEDYFQKTSRRPDMQTGSGPMSSGPMSSDPMSSDPMSSDYTMSFEYMSTDYGMGMGGSGNGDEHLSKMEKFLKKVNRLPKFCFKPSRNTEAMCASEFFTDMEDMGFGDMNGNYLSAQCTYIFYKY